jgi:beta-galactosidase
MKTLFLRTWKFALEGRGGLESRKDPSVDPWAPSFDDAGWKDVVVPHDWAVTFPFSEEHSSGTGYLPGGTGWYRAVFDGSTLGDPAAEGSRAAITFEGVYKNARVWMNGSYLGKRPSGYIGFTYDVSHCLKAGRNTVAVKVSHEDIADSRWYTGSGIYRRAFVDLFDAVSVRGGSLAVRTEVSGGAAEVAVSGEAVNAGAVAAEDAVIRAVLRGKGDERFTAEARLPAIAAGASVAFDIRIAVPEPRLWSADSPNLYGLAVELRSRAGGRDSFFASKPIRVGIRSIRFDADAGFFINGKSEKLRGVCFHHDSGCLGAAFWPEVWRRRLGKLKAAGCNAVRCSHNPQAPELYDLCDEMGFYVMDEAFDEWEGCKNKWHRGHNVYPPAHQGGFEDFPQWHERDLSDLVVRDRNHPSVILWSIGNEIDYPNDPYVHPLFSEMVGNNDANKPAEEQRYDPDKPGMERLATIARELVGIVKARDETRPVLAAAAFPELSSRIGFLDSLDVAGYNYKERLYEADHARFPRLPILGSENGHGLEAWKAARDNDYISGQFLWTGIDFLGEARGWPARCSGAGILDTAGYEKPGYYRRKILWSEAPALCLATCPARREAGGSRREASIWDVMRSWNYADGAEISVLCYTNLDSAELFLNGKSLGAKERDSAVEFIAWSVPFERGRLEARGLAPTRAVSDELESTLPIARLKLTRWEAPSAAGIDIGIGIGAEGDDAGPFRLSQVEIEALDGEGRLCADASPMVEITFSKGTRLLGLENGDISDCSEYSAPRRRAYRGRLIAYALTPADPAAEAWLEAYAESLRAVRIDLRS